MDVSIIISTKNRLDDLRRALPSALAQTPATEIIVVDDGSTDGTHDAVRREFPGVRVIRSDVSLGCVAQRNRATAAASGDLVVSMDDDAVLSSPDVVRDAASLFDSPEVGAVAIPFINVNSSPRVLQKASDTANAYAAASFVGTAYAVRRDVFLSLGGYRECFVHQGEEEDLCIRLLAAGKYVRVGTGDPVLHYESPRRSWERMDYYGKRNLFMFAWCNVPARAYPLHVAASGVGGLLHVARTRRYAAPLKGMAAGLIAPVLAPSERRPVPLEVYRAFRWMRRAGIVQVDELRRRVSLS